MIGIVYFIVLLIVALAMLLSPQQAQAQTTPASTTVIAQDADGKAFFKPIPQIDSVTTLGKLISTLVVSSFIHVNTASANLDTGKVYSIEGAGMTTLNLPSYSGLGSSGITILGTGSGLYKIHPASGQQLVSPNGMAATNSDVQATNPYCAMVLRPNGNGQWKSTLTTGSFLYNSYKLLNAVGSEINIPSPVIVNTTSPTEIFRDTIQANTLNPGQCLTYEFNLKVATPLVAVGTITLDLTIGTESVSILNSVPLSVANLSSGLETLTIKFSPVSAISQTMIAQLNSNFPVLGMTSSNVNSIKTFNQDFTTDKIIKLNVTLSNATNTVTGILTNKNLF